MPSRFSAFLPCLGELIMVLWTAVISLERFCAMLTTMLRVSQCYKIFWEVIIPNAVNMMSMFVRSQWSAKCLLQYPTVLKNVTVSIGIRVVRFIDVNVSAFVLPTPTLPFVTIGTRLKATWRMAPQIWRRMTFKMASTMVGVVGNLSWKTTPTFADARRDFIRVWLIGKVGALNSLIAAFGFLSMTDDIGHGIPLPISSIWHGVTSRFVDRLAATTLTDSIRGFIRFGGMLVSNHGSPPTPIIARYQILVNGGA